MSRSLLKSTRVNAGGFTGNGCVGEYHSPGTSPCATRRSSTPKIGFAPAPFGVEIQPGLPPSAGAPPCPPPPLPDAEDRLAARPIEDEHPAGLADGRERRDRSAVLRDIH